MRKLLLFAVMAMAIVCLVMPACSTLEDVVVPPTIEEEGQNHPYVSSAYRSDCYDLDNDVDSLWGRSRGWFEYDSCYLEMTIVDRIAKCALRQYEYNCIGPHKNFITHRSDSLVSLVVEEPKWESGAIVAACNCHFDVFFTLENLPEENFILEIFTLNEGESYKDNAPVFRKLIEYKDSTYIYERIFCL